MNKFKIAVIAHASRAGGGLYGTLNYISAFKEVATDVQLLLICSEGYGYEEIELPPGSELYVYKGSHSPLSRVWFERFTLPKVIDKYAPDAIVGVGNIGIIRPKVPQALFIRQPYLIYDKKYYSDMTRLVRLKTAFLKFCIKQSLPRTQLIFAQTPVVKKRFSERYKYPENQIQILRFPSPAEIVSKPKSESPSILDKTSGEFSVLFLTRYLPHRNPMIILSLCERYLEQIKKEKIKFITTVKEEDHPRAKVFIKRINKGDLKDVIINVGQLSREEVSQYMSHCNVLWLHTLLETLCLPFLEAMSLDLPVLVPDFDFTRYVCGKAGLFYDPWDVNDLYDKLMQLKNDSALREVLIDRGREELKDTSKFSADWQEVAADTIKALKTIAGY